MPSLTRFLTRLCALVALGWLGLWLIATYVPPPVATVTIDVPIREERP